MSVPSFLPPPSPEDQQRYFYQTCESRNITLEQAQLYGFAVDVANNINTEYGLRKNALFYNEVGFRIPHHDFDWNVIPNRETTRRSNPPKDDKGKIQQKYLRHAGIKGSCLYLTYREDWHDVRQNIRIPIIVVEGEFKAIFLHNILDGSYAVVGLSGAQMFATRDVTGTIHLPDLWDGFEINGRDVIFLFDQDRKEVTRQQVYDALMKAASRVQMQNGRAYRVDLAQTRAWQDSTMEKMGVDDYFQDYGGTLKEMWSCKVAIEPQKPKYLELRDEWYFCEQPQGFINKDTGQFIKDAYWNSRVDNYIDMVPTDNGTKPLKAYKSFREAEDRPTVRGFTFVPGQPQIINGLFNSWHDWPEWAVEGDKKAVEDLVTAMHTLCGCEEGDRVLDFMAHTFQHPEHRPQHAFLLKSSWTGTGKSTMCRVFMEVAGDYGVKASGSGFYNHFNLWAKDRLVIWVDEIKSSDMSTNQTTEHLNDFITMPMISIEAKGIDIYSIPFYARLIMASNDTAPIHMTKTERRTNVIECTNCMNDQEHIARLRRLNTLKADGKQAVLDYFMTRDIRSYDPDDRAVITDSTREIMELSQTHAEIYASLFITECRDLVKDADGVFYRIDLVEGWCRNRGYTGGTTVLGKAIAAECVTAGLLHQCSSDTEQVQMKDVGKGRWISFTGKRWLDNPKRVIFGILQKSG